MTALHRGLERPRGAAGRAERRGLEADPAGAAPQLEHDGRRRRADRRRRPDPGAVQREAVHGSDTGRLDQVGQPARIRHPGRSLQRVGLRRSEERRRNVPERRAGRFALVPGSDDASAAAGAVERGGQPALHAGRPGSVLRRREQPRRGHRPLDHRAERGGRIADVRRTLERGARLGFPAQISTDGGATYKSLTCTDTTTVTNPDALPTAKENVPGFTGYPGAWRPQACSLGIRRPDGAARVPDVQRPGGPGRVDRGPARSPGRRCQGRGHADQRRLEPSRMAVVLAGAPGYR